MEKLYKQAKDLAEDAEMITDNLANYNPGIRKKVVPLRVIQHDIATLMRDYSILYGKVGEKIRNDFKTKAI